MPPEKYLISFPNISKFYLVWEKATQYMLYVEVYHLSVQVWFSFCNFFFCPAQTYYYHMLSRICELISANAFVVWVGIWSWSTSMNRNLLTCSFYDCHHIVAPWFSVFSLSYFTFWPCQNTDSTADFLSRSCLLSAASVENEYLFHRNEWIGQSYQDWNSFLWHFRSILF